jgi:hypothetical protein
MKVFLLLIFLFLHSVLFSQQKKRMVFEEILADSLTTRLDSILIIGAGSTAARIFLDGVMVELIGRLKDKNIFANYVYVGRSSEILTEFLDTFQNTSYKKIMVFQPDGQNSLHTKKSKIVNQQLIGDYDFRFTRIQTELNYEGIFMLALYENDKSKRNFWKASLKINGDLGKSRNAKKISNLVIASFAKHNYVE